VQELKSSDYALFDGSATIVLYNLFITWQELVSSGLIGPNCDSLKGVVIDFNLLVPSIINGIFGALYTTGILSELHSYTFESAWRVILKGLELATPDTESHHLLNKIKLLALIDHGNINPALHPGAKRSHLKSIL